MNPAKKCTRCGIAIVPVQRVMLMVDGRAMNTHDLCRECLSGVFDAIQRPSDFARDREGVRLS